MKKAGAWVLAGWCAAASWPVHAQTPRASPSPASRRRGETTLQQPTAPVGPRSGMASANVDAAVDATNRHEGALRGIKALEIGDGKARLVLGGSERLVTPGTVLGTDTVKSVTPGRIVLKRVAPEAEGGDAIVIVTFDPRGRTRVQVFASRDPTTRAPAAVK